MKKIISSLICILSFNSAIQAQTTEAEDFSVFVQTIDNTVNAYYEVLSCEQNDTRDWSLFKYMFTKDAKIIMSINQDSINKIRFISVDDYIKTAAPWMKKHGYLEKEIQRTVSRQGSIAQIFSTYDAYYSETDEKPFMQGTKSFQLFHDGKRWWIVSTLRHQDQISTKKLSIEELED